MDKHLKTNRGIRLSDSTYLKLKYIANQDKRSVNNYIEIVLDKAIEDFERKFGEIKVDTDALYE